MATTFDLLFAAEDRYRVVLLQAALAESGMRVSLRNERWRRRSDPCLCVLSENSLAWMQETLQFARQTLIWIRLDDTLPPINRGRILDLRTWPGRSADGALTELVGVLKVHPKKLPVVDEIKRRNQIVLIILAFVLVVAFLIPLFSTEVKEELGQESLEYEEAYNFATTTPAQSRGDLDSFDSRNTGDTRHMGYADQRMEPPVGLQSAGQGIELTGIPAQNDVQADVVLSEVVQSPKTVMCPAPPNWSRSEA